VTERVHRSEVGWGTSLQGGRSQIRFMEIFHWHRTSGRTMAPGSTLPITKLSTRNIFGG